MGEKEEGKEGEGEGGDKGGGGQVLDFSATTLSSGKQWSSLQCTEGMEQQRAVCTKSHFA